MSNEAEITIPVGVSYEHCLKVLTGYYEAKAFKKPITQKKLATLMGIDPSGISRAVGFLRAAGFLAKEGSLFRLTDLSIDYLKNLSWGLEEQTQKKLREILLDYELTQRVLSFIRLQKNVSMDEIIKRIAIFADKPHDSKWLTGAKAFLDFLLTAEILKEEDGILSIAQIRPSEEMPELESPEVRVQEPYTSVETGRSIRYSEIPIQLSIPISPDTPTEEIVRILKAVRRGLSESLEEDIENEHEA